MGRGFEPHRGHQAKEPLTKVGGFLLGWESAPWFGKLFKLCLNQNLIVQDKKNIFYPIQIIYWIK